MSRMAMPVLALPRTFKRLVVIVQDIGLCVLSVWLAFYLRLGEFISFSRSGEWGLGPIWSVLASVAIAVPLFIRGGLYRAIFRYSGWPSLLAVARAVGIYGLFYATIFTVVGVPGVPRTVGIIQPILLLLMVGGSRALARFWLSDLYQKQLKRGTLPKVLIYGAGDAGRQLAAALAQSYEMRVVGFVDDDERLHGHVLNGLLIYSPDDLQTLVDTLGVSDIILAMPSVPRRRRNEIIEKIRRAHVAVRTLPGVSDLVQGKVAVSDLRELDLDDLLGREPVMPDDMLMGKNVRDRVVLVTGAGGSIGSELCRQILAVGPSKVLLVEHSEYALYSIHQELEVKQAEAAESLQKPRTLIVPLLASVQDEDRMREIMYTWRPDTVYHAAAYKHVPLVEHNPAEGIKNNVLGTLCTARAAIDAGVSDFVLISTDKAVRPTNVMGASKRLAEMILQALAATQAGKLCGTKFSMVRFGNVLGSSGSVVPKFRQQIRNGGPVTLTHPEVTRYFMTLPEAAQLVIQAAAMAEGGDVFVLDMGEPVKIIELARRMVELSGLTVKDADNPEGDIQIVITGLRPGEKLYEELLIGDDPKPTQHPRIMKAREDYLSWEQLEAKIALLERAVKMNEVEMIRQLLSELVSGYCPKASIVDWVYLARTGATLCSGVAPPAWS